MVGLDLTLAIHDYILPHLEASRRAVAAAAREGRGRRPGVQERARGSRSGRRRTPTRRASGWSRTSCTCWATRRGGSERRIGGGEAGMAERRDGVQVLSRAALLLRALSAAPEGLTPIELADRVGLPRSTCYRIVGALCQEGLMRLTPSGKLRIGAGLIEHRRRRPARPAPRGGAVPRAPLASSCTRPSSSSCSTATRRSSPTSTCRSGRCASSRRSATASRCTAPRAARRSSRSCRTPRPSGSSPTSSRRSRRHTNVDRAALLRELDVVAHHGRGLRPPGAHPGRLGRGRRDPRRGRRDGGHHRGHAGRPPRGPRGARRRALSCACATTSRTPSTAS